MDHTFICDELIGAAETLVRERIDAAEERAKTDVIPFVAAYLRNRFEELGAKTSVVGDTTKHSREHLYMIFAGNRPLSDKAAVAISETYPDITLAELFAVVAIANIAKARSDD